MVKPTLMHNKMEAMIKASRVLQVDRAHIEAVLACENDAPPTDQ
jgi:hypothetical protein